MTSVNEIKPIQQAEVPTAKVKSRKPYNNKTIIFNLDIDAGAKNVKARLNGEFVTFPSEFKVISDDVPLKDRGCFLLGSTD